MSTPKDDRRGAVRRVLRTKVQLLVREGLVMDARTLNISESGMAIVSDGPLVPGLMLTLRCLPIAAGLRQELITQARVVHCVFSNADGSVAIGLLFVSPSAQAMATISSAISRMAASSK